MKEAGQMTQENNAETISGATIDADEVAKFTAMAAEWWDPHGKFRPPA